jgi:cAMP-dependent protein kinase regulator
MTLVKAEPNQDIIKQNDDGDFFYVIASGRFAVLKSQGGGEPQQVFVYENQGSFGELALMYNAPRAATVRALTEGVLWAVDRATFRHIVLGNAQRERSKREQWLEQVSILSSLTRGERAQVADALKEEDYQPGAHVIRFGEQGDTLYIVVEGEAVASKLVNGTETELGRMQVGEYFGERALLTQEPRAANVRAVGRLRVAVIHRSTFERLLGSVKELMERELERYKPVGPLKTMTDEQLMESMLEDTSALTKRKRLLDRRLAEIRSEKERLSKVLASKGGQ